MSDFNYNNNGDFNNQNNGGNKPPTQKSAIVITTIVVAGIVMIFLGAKSNNVPLIMGCFFAVFITVFVAAAFQGKKNSGAKSGISGAAVNRTQLGKYYPLLADERTKLHPEVQRLLQYPAVQKAFFDPSSLSSSTIASDPNVRELLLVFDEMLAQGVITGNAYGIPPAQQQTGAILSEKTQIENREKEKKKPIQKVGKVLTILGITIFLLPFLFAFLTFFTDSGITQTWAFVFMFNMAPFGMVMIIVGIIFGRR